MTWNRWYALRSYLKSSLWIVPFIALLLEQVIFRIVYALDARLTWIPPCYWPCLPKQMRVPLVTSADGIRLRENVAPVKNEVLRNRGQYCGF